MSKNFKLQFGKHKGKTLEWLEENDKGYLNWAKENAPKILIPPKEKISPTPISTLVVMDREKHEEAIRPNLNFYNEGPADVSKKYIKKMI